jgi:putative ABC transport system permease protein
MKYLVLVWGELTYHRGRTLLTLSSMAVVFLLYCTLQGVTIAFDGFITGLSDTRLYIQNRVNLIQSLPLTYLDQIERVPGVTRVAFYQPLPAYYQEPINSVAVGAIDVERFLDVSPNVVLPVSEREALLATRTGAVAGRDLAERWGWRIGDRVVLRSPIFVQNDGSDSWSFDIVGIYDNKNGSNDLYVRFDYYDEATSVGKGRVLLYYARIDDPREAASVADRIDRLFENSAYATETQNERDWMRVQLNRVGNINFLVNTVVGTALFTLLLVTANTIAQSVRGRVAELAILKAIGYGDAAVASLVVGESLALCCAAALIGAGAAALVSPPLYEIVVGARFALPARTILFGFGVAIGLAVLSAVLPAVWAGRLNVSEALRR